MDSDELKNDAENLQYIIEHDKEGIVGSDELAKDAENLRFIIEHKDETEGAA